MEILNLGVFAHVDEGTAVTDGLPVERSRGISVRSASAAIDRPGLRVNLIDTPGHYFMRQALG